MGKLDFSSLDTMNEAEERRFMTAFTHALTQDKGEAAREHLAAGRAIYYSDDRFRDAVVKEYPDGRRQLVTFQADEEVLLRDL
jgi:hypothetical protein